MVSLLKRKSRYVIQLGTDRSRMTIPLGAVSRAAAETVRTHVRHLERAANTGTMPPAATAQWLEDVSAKIHAKLAVGGLTAGRREKASQALGRFIDGYIAKRTDLKERTLTNLRQSRGKLVEFFGSGRDLTTITPGEAADWRRKLAETLEQPTVAMHVKKARQFFADAISRRLIAENPFLKVKAGAMTNDAKKHYIDLDTIQKVIDACPDSEWRLLFAMARFGTVRVPSEIRGLQWGFIDWHNKRMIVLSPKTEHHEGRDRRMIPIVPELMPHLVETWDAAAVSELYVFARLRYKSLVTQAEKIIEKAGVARWPRLWQNLRSSCQTDLERRHPGHVVCAWMGNTPEIARKHYLQVTDDDFRAALGVALVSEQHRTTPAGSNEKAPETPGQGGGSITPKGSSTRQRVSSEKLGVSRPALRRALRRTKNACHPAVLKAEVARLRKAVPHAS